MSSRNRTPCPSGRSPSTTLPAAATHASRRRHLLTSGRRRVAALCSTSCRVALDFYTTPPSSWPMLAVYVVPWGRGSSRWFANAPGVRGPQPRAGRHRLPTYTVLVPRPEGNVSPAHPHLGRLTTPPPSPVLRSWRRLRRTIDVSTAVASGRLPSHVDRVLPSPAPTKPKALNMAGPSWRVPSHLRRRLRARAVPLNRRLPSSRRRRRLRAVPPQYWNSQDNLLTRWVAPSTRCLLPAAPGCPTGGPCRSRLPPLPCLHILDSVLGPYNVTEDAARSAHRPPASGSASSFGHPEERTAAPTDPAASRWLWLLQTLLCTASPVTLCASGDRHFLSFQQSSRVVVHAYQPDLLALSLPYLVPSRRRSSGCSTGPSTASPCDRGHLRHPRPRDGVLIWMTRRATSRSCCSCPSTS